MRVTFLAAAALLCATPALARTDSSYAAASEQSAQAAAALAEAGVKTVTGLAAVPLGVAGLGSAAVGSTAEGVADVSNAAAADFSQAGVDAVGFATSPLTVTDTVVLAPQPAPNVPFETTPPK